MADRTAQLIEQVQSARSRQQPLTIVGGGSKAFMGRAADSSGEVLNLAGHSGIVSYEPVELVMRARAGTTLAEIESVLAERGQMMAFEPPTFGGAATIGGTLACNQSGPGRPWQGSVRDHVLGVHLINGWGEYLRFGGQVMKNVAGYDLSRMQAGAMGTLGVITEVSFKVLPRPAMTLTIRQSMDSTEALAEMNRLAGQPRPLSAACWHEGVLYLRLSGEAAAVEATVHAWPGEEVSDGDAFWQTLANQALPFFATDNPLWRFSIGSTATLGEIDSRCLIDWGGAQRWYTGEGEKAALEALAEQAGGQVSLFAGGDRKGEVMHRLPVPMQALQTRLKQAFDPDRLFNPGRVYGWM